MEQNITVVGLDVSKKTLVTGVLPPHMDRATESKTIPNDPQAIEREVRRWAAQGPVIFVYEAGPCGYQIHRQIVRMGCRCAIVAPGLIPARPTDRVKTDRLHRKYWRLVSRAKHHSVAVTAVARELAGFVWAIGQQVPSRLAAQ